MPGWQVMLIFDDIYKWEGWGGAFRLGSGRCRLRIYNLKKMGSLCVTFIRPYLVVVTDLPRKKRTDMSVKSCNSHIASSVVRDFHFNPQRIQFIEWYPARRYGKAGEREIAERFEAVDFTWHGNKATMPVYRDLAPPMLDIVKELVHRHTPPPA